MSKEIALPIAWQVRLFGPLVLMLCAALVGSAPLGTYAQLGMICVLLVFGSWQWRQSLRQQARHVAFGSSGILHLDLADGRRIQAHRVSPGIVRPWLLSASVFDRQGQRADLFVPGSVLTGRQHWQLRRAVIGFSTRPDD